MVVNKVAAVVRLAMMVGLTGSAIAQRTLPVAAQETREDPGIQAVRLSPRQESDPPPEPFNPEPSPSALTLTEWFAQIEASRVQITGIRVETSEGGLQIVLETPQGVLATPTTQTIGNALIADIPNAVMVLPEGDIFEQFGPAEGIALISVTNEPEDIVRVAITGTNAPPVAAVTPTGLLVRLGEAVAGQAEDAIQVVVTGEQDGYRVPNASVGTRTETPLRDIPASIQVVPRQVLEEQQATRFSEVVNNVPGVNLGAVSPRTSVDFVNIRGFQTGFNSSSFLRNGMQDPRLALSGFNFATIERVEFLRGPASVLYGNLEPGGAINFVTKQPLSEPFYSVEASIGSFNSYRGSIDLSGSLNDTESVLYRFNAGAQTSDSFIDFLFDRRYIVAPTFAVALGEQTSLNLWGEYFRVENSFDQGLPAIGTVLPNPFGQIPRSRNLTDPNNLNVDQTYRIGFDLEHQISSSWQLRSAFLTSFYRQSRDFAVTVALLPDNRTMTRTFGRRDPVYSDDFYNFDTYLSGSFFTGSIQHELTTGVNLRWNDSFVAQDVAAAAPIDIFDPVYTPPTGPYIVDPGTEYSSRTVGLYVQDQITLLENLKLVLGGRFDFARQEQRNLSLGTAVDSRYQEFSPRLGVVYQPFEPISLYASYSRSFSLPDAAFSDVTLQPQFGTQYEIGLKAEINDRLSANLAFYNLTRSNIPTTDPNNPLRTIQVGEQRSRGIEFDISGEILPGWNILAGYALTDAVITQDNAFQVGNALNNIPRNTFNIWTTYEIQSGDLQGLGFGLGLFYVDNRPGDLANTFEIPSYLRTDAAIFYERGPMRLGLNFRNLFNVDYFAAAQNRNRVYQGDPFTVQGTISWQF